MPKISYIVHKTGHTVHVLGGCGYSEQYNASKYDGYRTLEEAYRAHGDDAHPCKYCTMKGNDVSKPTK